MFTMIKVSIILLHSFGSQWFIHALNIEAPSWKTITDTCLMDPKGNVLFFAKYGFYPCDSNTCPSNGDDPFGVDCHKCCKHQQKKPPSSQPLTKEEEENEYQNETPNKGFEQILVLGLVALCCGFLLTIIGMALYIKNLKKKCKIRSIRDASWTSASNHFLQPSSKNNYKSPFTKSMTDTAAVSDDLFHLTLNPKPQLLKV